MCSYTMKTVTVSKHFLSPSLRHVHQPPSAQLLVLAKVMSGSKWVTCPAVSTFMARLPAVRHRRPHPSATTSCPPLPELPSERSALLLCPWTRLLHSVGFARSGDGATLSAACWLHCFSSTCTHTVYLPCFWTSWTFCEERVVLFQINTRLRRCVVFGEANIRSSMWSTFWALHIAWHCLLLMCLLTLLERLSLASQQAGSRCPPPPAMCLESPLGAPSPAQACPGLHAEAPGLSPTTFSLANALAALSRPFIGPPGAPNCPPPGPTSNIDSSPPLTSTVCSTGSASRGSEQSRLPQYPPRPHSCPISSLSWEWRHLKPRGG